METTSTHGPAGAAESAQVTANHRQRLLAGLAAALRESSYWEITVADVVRHARTSRRTFYEHFAGKQDCFVALLEEENEQIGARIAAAVNSASPWQAQVRQAIEAWIRGVQEDPGVRLCWIRVVPSLGDAARPLLRRMMAAYAGLIRTLAQSPELASAGVTPPTPRETVMLLGGLKELIATTVEDGDDLSSIIDIATDVTIRILAPHAGPGTQVRGRRPSGQLRLRYAQRTARGSVHPQQKGTGPEAYALPSMAVSFRVTQYANQTGSASTSVPPKAVDAVIPKSVFPADVRDRVSRWLRP